MSFFQGLGNFAGGVSQGASPFIQMMMRDKMEQDKETRESEKLQGAMSMMQDQVPAFSKQEIGEMQSAGFTPQERPAGAEPMRQSSGGSIMEKKASFVDTLANMSPNEALGAYTAKLAEHGVKIDKTSLGVFDMLSKGVAQGKADLIAEEDRTQKEIGRKAQGLFADQLIKADPKMAALAGTLTEAGLLPEDIASILPTAASVFKSDESNYYKDAWMADKIKSNETIQENKLKETKRHNGVSETLTKKRVDAYIEKVAQAKDGKQKLTVFDKKVQAVMANTGQGYDDAAYSLITMGTISVKEDPTFGVIKTTTKKDLPLPPLPAKIPEKGKPSKSSPTYNKSDVVSYGTKDGKRYAKMKDGSVILVK